MAEQLARKLLLIGWDGADWQIIKPMLERGEMPALESVINQGVMGNLASMNPMISPMLWTTMATGKPPHAHGICGFTVPDPTSPSGTRLANSTGRKCKAFWNILTQNGLKVHTLGWFASHPAEPINGICVSDLFAKPLGLIDKGWPMLPGSVHPAERTLDFLDLRIHPQEISLEQLEYFVPRAKSIDQSADRNLSSLALQLAECGTLQGLASHIVEHEPWDMLAVYFNTIDHVCHGFMYYHPPRMDHIPPVLYELYKDVVEATYRFHDMMLGYLLTQAGDDVTVMIVSDHGYQTGNRRPVLTPDEPAGPTAWHRPYGILAMKGPHIRRDELVFGARLLDLTPTILTLFGLPVGKDMTGRALCQIFDRPVTPELIPSWEDVPGEAGLHAADARVDPIAEQAAMQQLIDLGYLDPIPADKQAAIQKATDEHNYNMARSFMGGNRHADAVELLEAVHCSQPTRLSVALCLADCYQKLDRREDCKRLVDHIASGDCYEMGMEAKNVKLMPQLDLLYGLLAQGEGDLEKAVEHFTRAEAAVGGAAGLHTNLGNVYLQMKRFDDAARAFSRALEVDHDDPVAHHGLAIVHLEAGRDEEAADAALASLEILYHQPRVHYHLGLALLKLGQTEQARRAFEMAVSMDPHNKDAHWQLASLAAHARSSS